MGKVNKQLPSGETVTYEAKLHWKIFILPILILLVGGYLYLNEWFILSYPFLGIGFIWLVVFGLIPHLANKFFVTTKHASQKHVFPSYFSNDIPLTQISGIIVEMPILGRILNYGNVVFQSASGKQVFKDVSSPKEFRQAIEEANSSQTKSGENTANESTSDNNILPTKATFVLPSELEGVQKEFEFYSPAQKSYPKAPSPKEGEVWRLERTLPSGLNLLLNTDDSYKNEIKELLKWKLLGINPYRDFDDRPYVYDIEKFLSEDSRRDTQHWETESISWHPTKKWLVTAGTGSLAKIWDVENGNMTTKHPFWDTKSYTSSSADGTLCWSYDGAMFVSFNDSYDGNTGERLTRNLTQDSSSYSNEKYYGLRGGEYRADGFRTASPFSSTNNFSLWRPNSEQFMNGRNEENLILRNRRTGEIEKIIDCGVTSKIKDFAWHPKGRFIAVTFENDNIRVIDLDDAKIVADLSVQILVGWSPDGKMLVARKEKSKDDFVIWDALETEEKPMSEEIKNELWFKRFFKNISADGLRYIKVEHDENYVCSTNIYSVKSDELVATLPKEVTSAAWCPIDGGLLATCGKGETRKGETHIWRI